MTQNLLTIEDLRTYFYTEDGIVKAVDGVDLQILSGSIVGLVGESGSGKSVTALSIVRLIERPGRIVSGRVMLDGRDLLALSQDEMRRARGKEISMIFQDPMTSLNPVYTIQDQMEEPLILHRNMTKHEARAEVLEMLRKVRIPDPDKVARLYPHELSGGMRQRVMIAMALSCKPKLLIADEPTTSLDVTLEAEILDLMKNLVREVGASVLLITHDIGIVAETCDSAAVMYAGNVVESADVGELFANAKHPYTTALLNSIVNPRRRKQRLAVISGTVPNMLHPPDGCRFHPRCPYATEKCAKATSERTLVSPTHSVACSLHDQDVKAN
jgi:oligopeptide/dipeptide ABC transporter ATP-binding protein